MIKNLPVKTTIIICLAAFTFCAQYAARADEPTAISTFHSIGLYWTPDSEAQDKTVLVRYREQDTDVWFDGLAMRYNPIPGTELDLADYRGSLVHLRPGATYEIELSMDDGSETKTISASTWPKDFPIARTIQVPSSTEQVDISESGSADGYVLYDGTDSTIDVADQSDYNLTIQASYVIIRGLTLKAAHRDAIRIFEGHDIIIEGCDISGWGRIDFDGDFGQNMDAAVFCSNKDVTRLVVQRCLLHDPRYDSNSWAEYNCHSEGSCSNHPAGPQTIALYNSAGNHVFRYNSAWSDSDHYYNDILGDGANGSYEGFPGPDSDIYGNDLANCWDDGIEAEGGGRNVRIWNNHDTDTYLAYANAPVSIGPMYWWRNVSGRCFSPDESQHGTYGPFMKMGYASSVNWMTGHMYLFHNTIWNKDDRGCGGLGGSSRWIKHCVTRNNVLHVRSDSSRSIAIRDGNVDNDFDYDLYSAEVPQGTEAHGINGVPTYAATGYDPAHFTGDFQLQPGTSGHDGAAVLHNFDEYFLGSGPDMGIQETGTDPMIFGVEAGYEPTITTGELSDAVVGIEYHQSLSASAGRGPVLWTLIAGNLPDGLELNRDGTISGVAQQEGSFTFSVYARDADFLLARKELSISVAKDVTCILPEILCGQNCVDISRDHDHCGSCDIQCNDDESCVDSTCSPMGEEPDGAADGQSDGSMDAGADEQADTNDADHERPDQKSPDASFDKGNRIVGGCACRVGNGQDTNGDFILFFMLCLLGLRIGSSRGTRMDAPERKDRK